MSHYADSKASFQHRALEIGLQDDQVGALSDHDLVTYNKLAYAVCGQPGQIDEARFQNVLTNVFQGIVSLGVEASMRQLCYEPITIAIAAIKQRVEPKDDKVLPPQERDERTRRVADSITGFEVKGDLEPAHCVVDAYISMVEESCLKILPLSKCISRDQELNHAKVDKSIVTIENHQLQVRPKELEVFADLSTELRVQHAFTRRGLALEMANLMSYNVREKITRSFMSYLTQSVPSAFQRPDISAILRADRELWTRAADECRSNLKVNAHGKLPLDEAMLKLYQTAPVLFFLLPLPKSAKRAREDEPDKRPAGGDKQDDDKPPKNPKKKSGDRRAKVPEGLRGYSGINKHKKRVCYKYNMAHGCQNTTKKDGKFDACNRGIHQCIKCHEAHSLMDCSHK